jgi:predicted phosphodiesterase
MIIKLVSDLHLEFSDITIPNTDNVDVLVLGGDILVADKLFREGSEIGQRFRDFLKRCSQDFPQVIWIAGNHEFYGGGHFYGHVDLMREYCANNYENVYFLECDTKIIDNVKFVGASLWTDMNRNDPLTVLHCKDSMNDYKAIKNDRKGYISISPRDTIDRHCDTLEYFRQAVAKDNDEQKIAVISHHTPSWQSCAEQYRRDYLMNGAFHNNLEDFILDRPDISLWLHGHTHVAFDYILGNTRVVCNPRGYQNHSIEEETGWNINKVIEI